MLKQTPKFSIITITYNAEKVLEKTIQSVQQQSYTNYEYIIVDGASKDHTMSIIDKYRTLFTTVISERDKGLYDAMNKGIDAATGDYLCFLNAGDCWHDKDTLSKMVASIGENLPDVMYGETAIVDSEGTFLRMRRLSAPEVLSWKSFRNGMLVCHQAFFAKRSLAPRYDLSYRFSADFDWCIRVMKQAKSFHNTHTTVVDYLDEGLTTQNHKASLKERFYIMAKHYGWISTLAFHAWFVLRLIYKKA